MGLLIELTRLMNTMQYIIDATVKELARRTTSQIQVIDIARLAAEQCGHYWIGEQTFD